MASEDVDVHWIEEATDKIIGGYCYLVREVDSLRSELAKLRECTYCVFCGATFPIGEGDDPVKAVVAHVRECPKHIMREPEAEAARLRDALEEAEKRLDYSLTCRSPFDATDAKKLREYIHAALREGGR